MISTLIGWLTSRLAGPIATAAAIFLALLLAAAIIGKGRAEHSRDEALQARDVALMDLGTCRAGRASLESAIAAQNASLTAKSEEDARRLAGAEKAVGEALKGRARAEVLARKLSAPPVGVDACARSVAAFENVKANLQ